MQVGDKVELINEVRGSQPGVTGIIKTVTETEAIIQLDPQQNNAMLPVQLTDIKVITEPTLANDTTPKTQRRKTAKN